MSDKSLSQTEKEILRVALDKDATHSYAQMVSRLRSENLSVKIHPSAFVSFLVKDFFATYFEKDKGVLIAEFFDSKSFYESQMERAQSDGNSFEKVMAEALDSITKIKSKSRCMAEKKGRSKRTNMISTQNEEV